MIPLEQRLEVVPSIRFVDAALPALTHGKLGIWRELRFDIVFKGDDWRGTEKGNRLERDFAGVGAEIVHSLHTIAPATTA